MNDGINNLFLALAEVATVQTPKELAMESEDTVDRCMRVIKRAVRDDEFTDYQWTTVIVEEALAAITSVTEGKEPQAMAEKAAKRVLRRLFKPELGEVIDNA